MRSTSHVLGLGLILILGVAILSPVGAVRKAVEQEIADVDQECSKENTGGPPERAERKPEETPTNSTGEEEVIKEWVDAPCRVEHYHPECWAQDMEVTPAAEPKTVKTANDKAEMKDWKLSHWEIKKESDEKHSLVLTWKWTGGGRAKKEQKIALQFEPSFKGADWCGRWGTGYGVLSHPKSARALTFTSEDRNYDFNLAGSGAKRDDGWLKTGVTADVHVDVIREHCSQNALLTVELNFKHIGETVSYALSMGIGEPSWFKE